MSWAPFYAFYFQLQIAFFLSSLALACNNDFFSSFLFFQIVVCKLQLQISKIIVARESGKFMQHRLRIWLLESLTKILVPSWQKGLFIFHFISTLEDFVFGFFWIWCSRSAVLKNLTYKHELGESHAHTCGEFFAFMWQIWFTPNSTWSDLLKTLLNKHGLRIHGWGDFYSIWFWLTLPVAKGRERLWNLHFSFILCPTFWGVFIHQVWLCKLWLRCLLFKISLNM